MSFWPFTNALNSNNTLHKFLDSIKDYSLINVDDLLTDPQLQQELLNELNSVRGSYNSKTGGSGLQFLLQANTDNTQGSTTTTGTIGSDSISVTSSNNDPGNVSSKESKGTKLIELLIQPHILNGLIEYLEKGVDFFYEQSIKEETNLQKLLDNEQKQSDDNDLDIEEDVKSLQREEEEETENETSDEKFRRCVQAASDVLSIDLWIILNRIIETPSIMGRLWLLLKMKNLFESSPAVADLVHILDQLMDTNSIEFLNFVRRQDDLVDVFLDKIEVPILMDFFFRIIQTDKPDSPTGILETISQQDLITKLIDILKPDPSQFQQHCSIPNHQLFFKQTAATDFLKALVTISSNAALAVVLETNIGPNQLTRELVSPKVINTMINEIMLVKVKDKDGNMQTNKHGINNCVSIIIELIRKNNSDYDLNCGSYSSLLQNSDGGPGEINSYVMFQWLKDFDQNPPGPRDPIYLGDMLYIFSENLEKFEELIQLEPIPSGKQQQQGSKNSTILGFTRFKVSELIAELLHCSNMILLNSKRIRKIIHIRDYIRLQQNKRLKKALNDTISFPDSPNVSDVTSGLDDVSLDDIHFEHTGNETINDYKVLLEKLETGEDSEDEEPSISPENPFVCVERDANIRLDPCCGDFFKIKLIDLKILYDIVKMFTKYPWNNFFHNVVFDLIQQIFNGKLNSYNSFLIVELFKPDRCFLTDTIVKAYKKEQVPRPGYMGHLILVSEEIVKFSSLYKPDLISPVIVKAVHSKDWNWFVNEILLKTREVYNVILGAEQEDEGEDEEEENEYGFDSSTVGYLDIDEPKKQPIILGDSSNHADFIEDERSGNKDAGSDEPDREGGLSPSQDIDMEEEEKGQEQPASDNKTGKKDKDLYSFLDEGDFSDEEEEEEENNKLRRVRKHNES